MRAVRIGVLVTALVVTACWAYARLHAHAERRRWDRTLWVVVYVLGDAGPDAPAATAALRRSLDALAERLAEDRAALGPGPAPFRFELVGPLAPERLPPAGSPGATLLERIPYSAALWRAERAVRAIAPEPDPEIFDARVYLVLAPGADRSFAEGVGEAGGDVAVVHAALGRDALLAAAAVVHEALHIVGATDKYDAAGHAVPPAGLVAPDRRPPYPQDRAEIMVGELPLAPGAGRLPERAEEIGVGPETAREIGWIPASAP